MTKIHEHVTIKDVAQQAGVSIATVSHVLNKTRYVSEETTQRVNGAIADLGYYPNLLVRSLRGKQTYTIGLVIPSIANETFGLLAETIQKILFQSGYNLIICTTSYDLQIEDEAFNTLLTKKVDAVIAIPSSREGQKLKEIRSMGIPVVLVDRTIPEFPVDTVRVDNEQGMHRIIHHLIELGHTKIGYIDRKIDQSHSLEQKIGYKKALEEHGLRYDPSLIVRADGFDYTSGVNAVKTLLQRIPQLTAVCAYYDITALGALRGILDMGHSVPQDISVVGFDGMPITNVSCPRLTTISFPVNRIAKATCNLLIKRLEQGDEQNEKDIIFVPKLIVRDSTAPPSR